jgi:hypothetical protein
MKRVSFFPVLILGVVLSMDAVPGQDDAIKVLDKHVNTLKKFCDNSCGVGLVDLESFFKDNSAIAYHHELIRLALKKVAITSSLNPLFECWKIFKKEYRIEEELYLHEYSILIFLAYKNILVRFAIAKVSIAEIITLSAQIASLPIDQVLTALEHCYNQFMIILHQYGLQPGLSLAAWLRQYWWVPPVVLISMLYSIVSHFLLGRTSSPWELGNNGGDINSLFGIINEGTGRTISR